MPVNYSINLLKDPQKPGEAKKAYARAQNNGELTLKQLSKRIASQTTMSHADIVGVLTALSENMIEALRDGNQIDFGELGKFRLQLMSRGAESAEAFTANDITGVRIQFIPGKELRSLNGLSFIPVPTRAAQKAVLAAQKKGETTVDISPKPDNAGTSEKEENI